MKLETIKADIEKNVQKVQLKPVRESLLIENPQDLPKVVEYLKNSDEYKLDYLSSITASDYVEFLESVYHIYSMEKKTGPVTLRVRVKPDEAKIPSLVSIYRGAEFQERDNFDLYGIEYENHPDLRRIVMWEGFEGYPMRKNYEQENSEELDEEDILWLEKNNVEIPEDLRKKALEPEPAKEEDAEKPAE